jgi:hypothetical protein
MRRPHAGAETIGSAVGFGGRFGVKGVGLCAQNCTVPLAVNVVKRFMQLAKLFRRTELKRVIEITVTDRSIF